MPDCQITCINKSQSNGGHEHITHAGNAPGTPNGWRWTVAQIVESIDAKTNTFYVQDAQGRRANVGVVKPTYGQAYIRTHADGVWTDNLLSLPSCV